MSIYRNKYSNIQATETWLAATGIVTSNQDVMTELGWLPVTYDYPVYDKWRQRSEPGEIVLNDTGSGYVQKFNVLTLNAEELSASLGRYKGQQALERINTAWLDAEQNGVIESSAGFVIDANERANRDIAGLIVAMEATGAETASFCGADNSFHEVTLEQLKAMQLEVIQYGQQLYTAKWQMRSAIEAATSFEEVDAVKIDFTSTGDGAE